MSQKRCSRQAVLSVSLFALLALGLSGCSNSSKWVSIPKYESSTQGRDEVRAESFPWSKRPQDEVAPGYLIGISSPDPKVNGEYRIEFDNVLKLPYEIRVNTKGLTLGQLQAEIQKSYLAYFRSPSAIKVILAKKEYLVDVQGLVKKPGQYAVKQNSSLDEVIAKAEGLITGSSRDDVARYVRVSGPSGSGMIRLADYHSGAKALVPNWQGGDVLFFQTEGGALVDSGQRGGGLVHVLGQVKNPGDYSVEQNADFFTYLIKAGGPNDRADTGNITLIRTQEDRTSALSFDMQNVARIPQILPGDTVIFNADNASPLEKKSRLGANFANILSTIGIIVIALK